jgi:hypothetical protein
MKTNKKTLRTGEKCSIISDSFKNEFWIKMIGRPTFIQDIGTARKLES